MSESTRKDALKRLNVFVGEWTLSLGHGSEQPTETGARSAFEWALDGQFLVQRSEIPDPNAPDSLSIVAVNSDTDGYTQHYFDSRGVVRLYAMTLEDGKWTLLRNTPDFTPLDFSQRFAGTFSPDGKVIRGTWEINEGKGWRKDFDLTYWRVKSRR
jgi:hypothetical protein